MESFQPLINLLVLMSALSIAAERVTNVLKQEKEPERAIGRRALAVAVVLAVAVKANFFEIVAHMDAPWETLGWSRIPDHKLQPGVFLYNVAGSALTGLGLGFGSKFWHDVLDIVY